MNNRQRQLIEKQREMYKSLSEYQLGIINEYFAENMKNLRKICDPLILKKNIPKLHHDDLYAVAADTLVESLFIFNKSKNCTFNTFLIGNIKRAFYDWTRDNTRLCRCNILTNEMGKIIRDEENNVIIISNVSLDATTDDGIDICEKISSSFSIEEELINKDDNNETFHQVVINYLNDLSPLQRKILLFLVDERTSDEICEELHITYNHYKNCIKRIMSDEKIKPLRRLAEGK